MTQAFNLSQFANKVNTSGQADLTTAVTGTLPQANGGTGTTTAANGELLIGNGSGFTKATLTAGSNITVTNSAGGITIAAAGGSANIQTQVFTSPGTWTNPGSVTSVRVTCIGGGGGGDNYAPTAGGFGGFAYGNCPIPTSPVSVTVGSGGPSNFTVAGTPGGTSSFGSVISATGGQGAPYSPTGGNPGSGTVTTGNAIRTGNIGQGNPAWTAIGLAYGSNAPNPAGPGGIAYSTSGTFIAGTRSTNQTGSATGGVVIVEWVG